MCVCIWYGRTASESLESIELFFVPSFFLNVSNFQTHILNQQKEEKKIEAKKNRIQTWISYKFFFFWIKFEICE